MDASGARGHSGEGFAHTDIDRLKHAIDVLHHIACPEPQHAKAVTLQPCGAPRIVRRLRRFEMPISINLNDHARRQANEIGEIGA